MTGHRVRKTIKTFTAVFVALLLVSPSLLEGTDERMFGSQSLTVYDFNEHLSQADAWNIYRESKKKQRGLWKENRFVFPGLDESSSIYTVIQQAPNAPGRLKKPIQFNVLQDTFRRIRFYDVFPGRKLILRYEVFPQAVTKDTTYFYLWVWIGNHRMKRIRVPNTAGAHVEVIDLGVLSFVNRPFLVTFELIARDIQPAGFGFEAEILA